MSVNVEDVRIALNEISEEEISDKLIEQKIEDGKYIAEQKELDGYPKTKFIRAYAAFKSFIVSNTYTSTDYGEVSVEREWETILENLKDEMKEALIEGGAYQNLVIDSTPMFDSRPVDDKDRELSESSL